MFTFIRLIGATLAGVSLAFFVACATDAPQNLPGALPNARGNVAPRVSASTFAAHAHLLERQGDLEQAVAQYREALSLSPEMTSARNRLGITLNKLGRHAEASAEFRRALEHAPQAANLYNNLGFSLYLEGRFDESERALARAVELLPSFRRARMNHGLALARLGRDTDALGEFLAAGTEADAHYNLALVQTETSRYADAARSLERALALSPEFPEAREQLREVARLTSAAEARAAALAAASEAKLVAPAPPPDSVEAPPVAANPPVDEPPAEMVAHVERPKSEPAPPAQPKRPVPQPADCTGYMAALVIDALDGLRATARQRPLSASEQAEARNLIEMFRYVGSPAIVAAPWYDKYTNWLRDECRLTARTNTD